MTAHYHSFHSSPQFTTVHHSNCGTPTYHTTTVVAVGCGECGVECGGNETRAFHTHSLSTVGSVV